MVLVCQIFFYLEELSFFSLISGIVSIFGLLFSVFVILFLYIFSLNFLSSLPTFQIETIVCISE